MKIVINLFKPVFFVSCIFLVACGGNSSSTETGVFLDSPVSNIGYRTDTKEGVTNSLGEYDYIPGETVTFFIGDLEFPPVPAAGVVTPLDMAGTNDTTDTTLINIARLLQTLDSDGDPSTNGIVISEQAHKSAQNLTVDFSSPSFDNDVQFLVSNSGSPTTSLIDQADAIAHLSENVQCPDTPKTLKDYLVGKRIIVGSDFVELNYDGTVVDQYVEDGETSRVTGTYEINGLVLTATWDNSDSSHHTDVTFSSASPEAGDTFSSIEYVDADETSINWQSSSVPISSIEFIGAICL